MWPAWDCVLAHYLLKECQGNMWCVCPSACSTNYKDCIEPPPLSALRTQIWHLKCSGDGLGFGWGHALQGGPQKYHYVASKPSNLVLHCTKCVRYWQVPLGSTPESQIKSGKFGKIEYDGEWLGISPEPMWEHSGCFALCLDVFGSSWAPHIVKELSRQW